MNQLCHPRRPSTFAAVFVIALGIFLILAAIVVSMISVPGISSEPIDDNDMFGSKRYVYQDGGSFRLSTRQDLPLELPAWRLSAEVEATSGYERRGMSAVFGIVYVVRTWQYRIAGVRCDDAFISDVDSGKRAIYDDMLPEDGLAVVGSIILNNLAESGSACRSDFHPDDAMQFEIETCTLISLVNFIVVLGWLSILGGTYAFVLMRRFSRCVRFTPRK